MDQAWVEKILSGLIVVGVVVIAILRAGAATAAAPSTRPLFNVNDSRTFAALSLWRTKRPYQLNRWHGS